MPEKPIRFAAFIRVSTEAQKKKGESLPVQKALIVEAVQALGGIVAEWYGGSEHATPDHEKAEFTRLLKDAQSPNRQFDAVMVAFANRWSRDNASSSNALDILRKNGVRFFVKQTEHRLKDPASKMVLGFEGIVGEYVAALQKQTSWSSRKRRAGEGKPAVGRKPWGRTFNKRTGEWGIDPEKQKIIEDVAKRYLAGESMQHLASEKGMNLSNLHKILTRRSGDTWEQKFDGEQFDLPSETHTIKIPRLLPQATIDAIHARIKANKTFHGTRKNEWLLAGLVRCEHCGYRFFGQMNPSGKPYYRRPRLPCKKHHTHGFWVPAEALEDAVVRHLFNVFGDPVSVEKAMEAAVPDFDRKQQILEQITKLDGLIAKIEAGKERVARQEMLGAITQETADKLLGEANAKLSEQKKERDRLAASVANVPAPDELKAAAKAVVKVYGRRLPRQFTRLNAIQNWFELMTWNDKRELVTRVLSGTAEDGREPGIYVARENGKIRYTIRGLITRRGSLPMDEETAENLVDTFDRFDRTQQGRVVNKYASHCRAGAPRARRSCGPPARTGP